MCVLGVEGSEKNWPPSNPLPLRTPLVLNPIHLFTTVQFGRGQSQETGSLSPSAVWASSNLVPDPTLA